MLYSITVIFIGQENYDRLRPLSYSETVSIRSYIATYGKVKLAALHYSLHLGCIHNMFLTDLSSLI